MTKLIPFFILTAFLAPQCQSSSRRTADTINSQQKDKSAVEKKKCDFSEFNPLGPRANYGSQLLSMPQPLYPQEAKERGIKGRVSVLVLVNVRSGLVEQACIKDGDPALADAAKEAAIKVKFAPYRSPVQRKYSYALEILTYNFEAK